MKSIIIAVLVSATILSAPKPTVIDEPSPPIVHAEAKPPEVVEKKVKNIKKKIDPKGCEPEQYWAKEPPHNCIDKPKPKVNHPVNCEAYRHLIQKYDWNVETMMYAMRHESGCNPNAVGDNYTINGVYAPSCGLLQVRTLAGRPSCAALKDPATNIATAYQIWLGQGYRAWTVLH